MAEYPEFIFQGGCARPPNLEHDKCPVIFVGDRKHRLFNTGVAALIQAMINFLSREDNAYLEVESEGPGFTPRVKPSDVTRAIHPKSGKQIWPLPEI